MGERARELADRFERLNQELIATVEGASDEQWRATCSGETWSVAVTAHHVAGGHALIADFVERLAKGQPLPSVTMDQIHAGNAEHARQFANRSREETADLLRRNGAIAADKVRGLSDDELKRSAPVFGGQPMSAEQLIENILLGHIQGHFGSIKAAIGG